MMIASLLVALLLFLTPLSASAGNSLPGSEVECGRTYQGRFRRVVGGTGSAHGQYPWHVMVKEVRYLGTITDYKCGGVLISERFVITAAHCRPKFIMDSLEVVLGVSQWPEEEPQIIPVRQMIIHSEFNSTTLHNDIALLILDRPVVWNEKINPICLPESSDDFDGNIGIVTGWGKLSMKGGMPTNLQSVSLPIMSPHRCEEMYSKRGKIMRIFPRNICAGYEKGQLDACEGDSGGPLAVKSDGRWILAGLVSYGLKCAQPNAPGIYANVAKYRTWLDGMISRSEASFKMDTDEKWWKRPIWNLYVRVRRRRLYTRYL